MNSTLALACTLLGAGVGSAALTACSDDAPDGNPPRLWLALDGSELEVKLVSHEPPPF
ncbi:MAG TPA: hypothetical protein VHE35_37125 [Kofleriaceae bacterium]|nr:hypothetical protein [Kofleriaceae bacterium]